MKGLEPGPSVFFLRPRWLAGCSDRRRREVSGTLPERVGSGTECRHGTHLIQNEVTQNSNKT